MLILSPGVGLSSAPVATKLSFCSARFAASSIPTTRYSYVRPTTRPVSFTPLAVPL